VYPYAGGDQQRGRVVLRNSGEVADGHRPVVVTGLPHLPDASTLAPGTYEADLAWSSVSEVMRRSRTTCAYNHFTVSQNPIWRRRFRDRVIPPARPPGAQSPSNDHGLFPIAQQSVIPVNGHLLYKPRTDVRSGGEQRHARRSPAYVPSFSDTACYDTPGHVGAMAWPVATRSVGTAPPLQRAVQTRLLAMITVNVVNNTPAKILDTWCEPRLHRTSEPEQSIPFTMSAT
jgi:hypothetical protein